MALKYLDKLQVKYSEITKPYVRFEKFIGKLDNLDKVINSSEFLKEHSFYLNEIKENSQYLLSEKEKILISKIKNTGSKAWTKLQNILSSTLLVDIEIDGLTQNQEMVKEGWVFALIFILLRKVEYLPTLTVALAM